jgi:ribonuclease P protein component
LGVVAGKNVGNAVERNRAKRRLREAARRVDLRPDTAYVVVASHEVLDARFGDLVTWMDEAAIAGGDRRKDGK